MKKLLYFLLPNACSQRMKNLLVLALMLGCSINLMAYEASEVFVEGTCWSSNVSSIEFDDKGAPVGIVSYAEISVLDGKTTILGKECLKLWTYTKDSADRELTAYIYTDNDKVYHARAKNPDSWELMYDFGIQEGETCEVINPIFTSSSLEKLKYISTTYPGEYGNLPAMSLSLIYEDGEVSHVENAKWIKGIGSTAGVLVTINTIDGIGYFLTKVWNGDKVFMQYDETNEADQIISQQADIEVRGNIINVSNAPEGTQIVVYDLSGNTVSSTFATSTTATLRIVHPGIYIIKVGNRTSKLHII